MSSAKWRLFGLGLNELNAIRLIYIVGDMDILNYQQTPVFACNNRKCQDYVYIKWEYWSTM